MKLNNRDYQTLHLVTNESKGTSLYCVSTFQSSKVFKDGHRCHFVTLPIELHVPIRKQKTFEIISQRLPSLCPTSHREVTNTDTQRLTTRLPSGTQEDNQTTCLFISVYRVLPLEIQLFRWGIPVICLAQPYDSNFYPNRLYMYYGQHALLE